MKILLAIICLIIPACGTSPAISNSGAAISDLPLSKFTHADIKNAADYATTHGYPARAAVWLAIDTQLSACEQAIDKLMPQSPTAGTTIGLAMGFEIAAEGVGNGIPSAVKLNCSAVQLPGGLIPIR